MIGGIILNEDVVSRISKLQSSLINPLKQTTKSKVLSEITERIGSLGSPSKMPGYSWGISATMCNVGSKLAKLSDSPCSKCYALKGRYLMPNVQNALTKRLEAWKNDPDWVLLMSIRLLYLNKPHFRWFDSGDLQSLNMLIDINRVALFTPEVQHWLPTQERYHVSKLPKVSDNLVIRVSSATIDKCVITESFPYRSFVTTEYLEKVDGVYQCPSSKQNNQCGSCRTCWDKNVKTVAYLRH